MKTIEKGFYYHYKHNPSTSVNNYAYEIIGLAKDTENGAISVIYRPLYKNEHINPANFYSRPIEMFLENVLVCDKETPRFKKITDIETISKLKEILLEMYG